MIRIVQCLCGAKRHCILGITYEPGITAAQADFGSCDDITLTEANAAGYLRSVMEGVIARKLLDPWCGICGSREFVYEDARTRFKTMDEAQPEIQRLEEENFRSRQMIDALKKQAGQN